MPDRLILAILMSAGAAAPESAADVDVERADTCLVHGPSRLASRGDSGTSDYVPHYSGECRDGVAHGHGRLEWRMRWTPARNRAVWEGRFVDGVFVGTQAVEHVVALPGDRYLIRIADDGARRVWLVSRSGQFDPVSVCDIDRVVLDAHPAAATMPDAGDDAQVRALIEAGAAHVAARCPKASALPFEVYADAFVLGPNDNWPTNAAATATVSGLDRDDARIDGYRNPTSERARQAQRAAQRDARLQAQRDAVRAFADTHAIAAWLTSTDVDRNPFASQGQRVGMLLRLDRMIDASTAVAMQASNQINRFIVVSGITPSTFSGPATAVAVEVDAERMAVPGYAQPLAHVRVVASEACSDGDCSTWLGGIAWGQPSQSGHREH